MKFYTYILYSQKLDVFYKGHTNDVQARLFRHNSGQENFTSTGTPWKLIWFTDKPTKTEAYQLERKLKNLGKERIIRFILKHNAEVVGADELLLMQQFVSMLTKLRFRQHSSPITYPQDKRLSEMMAFFICMKFYTYILYSQKLDVFYKGHTNDVQARLFRHNSGQENFTSTGTPWKLIWFTDKPTKTEAYQLERKLKNLGKERVIRFILKHNAGVVGADELLLMQQLSAC